MTSPFKKIKVGVLNDHFDQLGGGTTHSFKLIEFLKRYYDVDVILPKNGKDDSWMKVMLNMDTEGVRTVPYARGIGNSYDYMFLNISHWKAEPTNALKKFMVVFFPQFYFPLQDYHLIANSEYTKENVLDKWNKKSKDVSVIYPPIQTSQFKPGKKENIILHVSRLAQPRPEADKGHLQMIQAFKKLKPKGWEFHIVGQVQDPSYVQMLKREASGANIIFHEAIPFRKLQELYAKSKIYWHMTGITMPDQPGAQEHFGMTIVEAMSAGCVPVVYKTGGTGEIVTKDNGFLISGIPEMVEKTHELIKDQKLLKKMSDASIKRAKKFDESNIKQEFYNLITKTNKVSIIMICWNNSKFTKESVERLYEVTPPGFELILVDNASTDNTPDVLKELKKKYKNIQVITSKTNLGFAGGNNLGLKKAKGDYICYLNNDTLPQPGWLEHMIDVLENDKKAGIVGARLYFDQQGGKWKIQHAGKYLDKNLKSKHIGRNQDDELVPYKGVEEVEMVTGACMLVRKELAKFNEKFERGYYEDDDMCLTVRKKGYRIYINHDARLIHYEGKSQDILKRSDANKFAQISEKNFEIFRDKWDKEELPEIKKNNSTIREGKAIKGLEIGGGENPMYPDYEQVDLRSLKNVKHQNDARVLPFPDNSVKRICACYVLQCLSKSQAEVALREWHRVLVPGGELEIHVPDIRSAITNYVATKDEKWVAEIYGEQKHELDYYKYGWTLDTLDRLLAKVNFVRVVGGSKPKHRQNAISLLAHKSNE